MSEKPDSDPILLLSRARTFWSLRTMCKAPPRTHSVNPNVHQALETGVRSSLRWSISTAQCFKTLSDRGSDSGFVQPEAYFTQLGPSVLWLSNHRYSMVEGPPTTPGNWDLACMPV